MEKNSNIIVCKFTSYKIHKTEITFPSTRYSCTPDKTLKMKIHPIDKSPSFVRSNVQDSINRAML